MSKNHGGAKTLISSLAIVTMIALCAFSYRLGGRNGRPIRAHCTMAVEDARLYSGPSETSPSFATIRKLSCVNIVECRDGWCEFMLPNQFGDGATAWIPSRYLSNSWPTEAPRTRAPLPTPTPRPTRTLTTYADDYRARDEQHYYDDGYEDYLEDIAADRALEYELAQAEYREMFPELMGGQLYQGNCVIKGNISYDSGERIYHIPSQEYYDETAINPEYGERWFCTEEEAQSAGWRRAYR